SATALAKANRLFDSAVASSACSTPYITENELFGASLPVPWSATNTQYRANVLLYLRTLAARGGHPFLLVSSRPYTAGDAGDWWRQVAEVADIVQEVYFPAPAIYQAGPILGNRILRTAFRRAILSYTRIGIPISKLGIMLGFHTELHQGGREGLKPAQAWFRTVKWQALSAKQVASEWPFATIWSWGWANWGQRGLDPDKPAAACVYLWTRDRRRRPRGRAGGDRAALPRQRRCLRGGPREGRRQRDDRPRDPRRRAPPRPHRGEARRRATVRSRGRGLLLGVPGAARAPGRRPPGAVVARRERARHRALVARSAVALPRARGPDEHGARVRRPLRGAPAGPGDAARGASTLPGPGRDRRRPPRLCPRRRLRALDGGAADLGASPHDLLPRRPAGARGRRSLDLPALPLADGLAGHDLPFAGFLRAVEGLVRPLEERDAVVAGAQLGDAGGEA